MRLTPFSVPLAENALAVSSLLYEPTRKSTEVALLLAHGFTAGKYSLDGLAGYLGLKGFPAVTFDFAGHKLGSTGGELRSMRETPDQLRAVLDWIGRNVSDRIVLLGHSMGAAASLAVACENHPSIVGIVSMCMGETPSQGFNGMIGKAMVEARADYVAGSPALELLRELDDVVADLATLPLAFPSLFIAGKQDVLIGPERIETLARRLSPTSEFQIIDSSHVETPDRSRTAILSWLQRQRF